MKYAITVLFLVACSTAFSQNNWHAASDTLKEPKNTSGYYITVAYSNRYDTVSCTYIASGSNERKKGFKSVYILHGYYTDDRATFQVFFNNHMQRIYNVERYSFR